jgi:hypothetical protein
MKLFSSFLFLIAALLITGGALGQQNKTLPISKFPVESKKDKFKDSLKVKDSLSLSKQAKDKKIEKEVDIFDFYRSVFKIKPGSKKSDTVTTKPSYSIVPAIGYTLVSKLAVVLGGNAVFKTGPNSRPSTVVANTSFTQRKQFTFFIESSIWSKDNNYNFVGDYRFYQYPQSTFGLGSSSAITHEDPMNYSYVRLYETVLRRITKNLYAGAGYIIDNHWNITDKGDFNDYRWYGTPPHTTATGFTLNASMDSRDNSINPTKGTFITSQYRDNFNFLGSTSSWSSLIVDVRKYINLPQGSDNVLALWSFEWLTLAGKPGFLDLPSTQWDTYSATGRGYIQGRFRGADMVYAEAEYRYKILDNGLLGGVFFLNAESLNAAPGTRLQGIQPGFGPGLRIKFNKVTKTNLCVDYGFGRQGSNGLFIDVGEIF